LAGRCAWEPGHRVERRALVAKPYHCGMKTTYIFGAILACSLAGSLMAGRSTKTAFLVLSGALSSMG
jgi:hypothetical protein